MRAYIKKLSLRNFQSHRESDFEFLPGLNIIVGPSDQGKSAIIRALRWLIYNEPRGTGFIRAGEARCQVAVEMSTGVRVERIREESGKMNRYILEIPGEEPMVFERFNKEVPLEIRQALGINKLVIDRDRSIEINLSSQLEAPFLMEESGANRSKVLGRIANLHIIDAAQRDTIRDIGQANQEIGRLNEEIAEINLGLLDFQDIAEQDILLEEVTAAMDSLRQMEGQYQALQGLRERMTTTLEGMSEASRDLERLAQIDEAQMIQQTLGVRIGELKQLEAIFAGFQANSRDKAVCEKTISSTSGLESAEVYLDQVRILRQEGFEHQATRKILRSLEADRRSKDNELLGCREDLVKLERIQQFEDSLQLLVNLERNLEQLNEVHKSHRLLRDGIDRAESDLKKRQAQIESLADEFGEVLQQAGRCPTCFAEISSDVVERIRRESF